MAFLRIQWQERVTVSSAARPFPYELSCLWHSSSPSQSGSHPIHSLLQFECWGHVSIILQLSWPECHFTKWSEAGKFVTCLCMPCKVWGGNCVIPKGKHLWWLGGLVTVCFCKCHRSSPASVTQELILREFWEEFICILRKRKIDFISQKHKIDKLNFDAGISSVRFILSHWLPACTTLALICSL